MENKIKGENKTSSRYKKAKPQQILLNNKGLEVADF